MLIIARAALAVSILAMLVSISCCSIASETFVREAQHHGYTTGAAYSAALVAGWPARKLLP
jgi:hypothetical protein